MGLQCVAVCCSAFCSALQCAVGQTAPYQARLMLPCVAVCSVCCSVLQCVALCCIVLQFVAVCCSVNGALSDAWSCTCCGVSQCVAVCLQRVAVPMSSYQACLGLRFPYVKVLQCVAVCSLCCSVLQCVALCCNLLQCVAVSMAPYQTHGVARVVCRSVFAACCIANVVLPGVLGASCPICQSPCQKSSRFCRCWRPGSWASQPSASAHGT